MLHSLFYLETVVHVSGGTFTHHQERKQLYLQHLVFFTPLLLPAATVEELELQLEELERRKHNYFNVHDSVHRNNILIHIQQDATLHNLFYLETALHISDGNSTHHQERILLYLQHLVFVTPLLLPAAMAAGSSNGVTNTRCCSYSCLRS